MVLDELSAARVSRDTNLNNITRASSPVTYASRNIVATVDKISSANYEKNTTKCAEREREREEVGPSHFIHRVKHAFLFS